MSACDMDVLMLGESQGPSCDSERGSAVCLAVGAYILRTVVKLRTGAR